MVLRLAEVYKSMPMSLLRWLGGVVHGRRRKVGDPTIEYRIRNYQQQNVPMLKCESP
jgi:hypothetical protein